MYEKLLPDYSSLCRFCLQHSIKDIALNIDIAPTIMDLGGLHPLKDMDGKSLVPLLKHAAHQVKRQEKRERDRETRTRIRQRRRKGKKSLVTTILMDSSVTRQSSSGKTGRERNVEHHDSSSSSRREASGHDDDTGTSYPSPDTSVKKSIARKKFWRDTFLVERIRGG